MAQWLLVPFTTISASEPLYLPRPDDDAPVTVAADHAQHWQQGSYNVWHLSGHCKLRQGDTEINGPDAALWIENGERRDAERPAKVIAYFERSGDASVTRERHARDGKSADDRVEAPEWFGRLVSRAPVTLQLPPAEAEPAEKPPIVTRGLAHFGPQPGGVGFPVEQAQFAQSVPPPTPVGTPNLPFRRIRVLDRSGIGYHLETLTSPQGESLVVLSGGVNVIVEGLNAQNLPKEFGPLGNIDLEADRVVIWGAGNTANLQQVTQQSDQPLEIYMEGNIVFRQGDRTVYADRMFYDVRRQVGVILDAELLATPPQLGNYQYQGLVRLKAAAVRQLDASRYVAQDAFVTTSRLEEPSYKLRAGTVTLTDVQQPTLDPLTGMPAVDMISGQPTVAHQYELESQRNFVDVAGVPVFYWPTFATNLEKPTYYVDAIRFRNDSVFGFQTLLKLDAFQLLGYRDAPQGVNWDFDIDFLSQRGLGLGTTVEYDRDSFFTVPGLTKGRFDAWGIKDDGVDNLGLDRRTIVPEKDFRGRIYWDHRQKLAGGLLDDWTVQAEVGLLSDRTFLEEYYENEWDNHDDQLTGVRLKRVFDNQSFSIEANGQVNDFLTQTQWLPRLDHNWLGQSLANDQITWFEHSSLAYANQGIVTTPTNPQLKSFFTLLPWEQDSLGNPADAQGERFVTRQELDFPIDLAPFKVVPYALGELGHWGADLNGNDINRAWGQVGLRASVPFWAVDPTVRDPLFNLNGLANKIVFDAEASYADANKSFDEFPLYDEIDNGAIDDLRRRLFFTPFGGSPPFGGDPKFDARRWAIRSGIQDWVTSPSTELADDLSVVRVGMRDRLQTKRGPAGEEHIVDWLTFDTNLSYFPQSSRDDFGSDFGLADYDLRWHLGDRFSILSDGAADFFGDGLRTVSIGGQINRPERGNAYLGFRTIDGPFRTNVVNGTFNYRLNPKWITSASASVALESTGNVNQALYISRIGESLIATVGTHYDESKNNFGFSFLVEPRFLPRTSVTRRTGIEIAPAGAFGLE